MEIILGIGDYAVSAQSADCIKTYALGSCVAVAIYEPDRKVLGMAHVVLPSSTLDVAKSRIQPACFADTAIPLLVEKMCFQYGCDQRKLTVRLFGGSKSVWKADIFNVGERNLFAIETILSRYNLSCSMEAVGGILSRTVEVDVATGTSKVISRPINTGGTVTC